LAKTESELLNHTRCWKLRYFTHVVRQLFDNIESSMKTGSVEGFRKRRRPRVCWFDNIMAWTALSRRQSARQALDGFDSFIQPIITKQRWHSDMTWHDRTVTKWPFCSVEPLRSMIMTCLSPACQVMTKTLVNDYNDDDDDDTISYDTNVFLCAQKLTRSHLSLPHITKKTKNQ